MFQFKCFLGTFPTVSITTYDIDVLNHTTKWVASRGGDIIEMQTIELSLEKIFLELMGIEAETGG